MTADILALVPLPSLLSAYAGRDAARHRLLWVFDARLAQIVRTTTEPMIGQMRLAWWEDVLSDESGAKGRGEPLLAALRDAKLAGHPGLGAMLDGWEALLGDAAPDDLALRAFGVDRGGGLFHALAGEDRAPESLIQAGAVWALWDLSGHVGSASEAARAIAVAQTFLGAGNGRDWMGDWPRAWRPMRLAFGLAVHDVQRGRAAPRNLTPRLYARLLRLALVGR
ncbi:hypothetical protein [Sphingobium aromaticiconvertens]|uniref:hypothetical protein n=1 Tax=Sphingobium aromaticiconvertens TaxID=365341 RepID=UPI0030160C8A